MLFIAKPYKRLQIHSIKRVSEHSYPQETPFNIFKSFYPVAYIIFLGITAGVFEECGRYMGFKLTLKKHRRFGDGVAFALGHGGIEALLIAGISSLYNLIILLNLNLGNYNGVILGVDANEAMIAFNSVNNISVLTIGLERILAMVIHLGLTMIVLYGIKFSKSLVSSLQY